MEKRFTQPAPVLNQNGSPNPGWASHGILQYNRKAIKAKPWRIKELVGQMILVKIEL